MDKNENKQRILKIATNCRDILQSRVIGDFKFEKDIVAEESDTNGWYCTIAIRDARFEIEIYLDTFPNIEEECLWVGFWSNSKKFLKNMKADHQLHDNDFSGRGNRYHLKHPMDAKLFRKPIYEEYKSRNYYFGIYYNKISDDMKSIMEECIDFLLTALADLPDVSVEDEQYSAIENRQVVAFHLRRERDPELARICKERDQYVCQVCYNNLKDIYGALANKLAEAHHIVPLHKIKGPIEQNVDHLKTVCPNCHRVLHRMEGREDDIDNLRCIYSQVKTVIGR